MRVYRHAELLPSGFIAMWVYRQAGLSPCGFIANGDEIFPHGGKPASRLITNQHTTLHC